MPRLGQHLNSRRLVPPTLIVLFVLGLAPIRWTGGFVGWFGALATTIVAPISHPAGMVSRYLRPPGPRAAEPEIVEHLAEQLDKALFMAAQLQQEVDRLRRTVRELQGGMPLAPDVETRMIAASVISRGSDPSRQNLTVRAGRSVGVVENSVAVVDGVQVLGRVAAAAPRHSTVLAITDRAAGGIEGVVVLADGSRRICRLSPAGDGTLRGPVAPAEIRAGEEPAPVLAGQLVRLSDPTWPRSAQMLEIGRVERVEPDPDNPLREIIVVRPRVDLARVSEVVLRVPVEPVEGEAAR